MHGNRFKHSLVFCCNVARETMNDITRSEGRITPSYAIAWDKLLPTSLSILAVLSRHPDTRWWAYTCKATFNRQTRSASPPSCLYFWVSFIRVVAYCFYGMTSAGTSVPTLSKAFFHMIAISRAPAHPAFSFSLIHLCQVAMPASAIFSRSAAGRL